ncbi:MULTISPECIES: twin-arginine translocase subunit TatC [unclassified Arenimonas]|uniref:twin-arginine translocase subunit TatC n=1 Tax=unclassified Arenimonas TaxID=2641713 RepID=UPI00086A532C|nr:MULTISPECIES: twin-arginine translocase subunit TatC [unclassified Arenimonas]ODS63622.1 MAG: twin arginine-targeting protein translocase TatC [Arenimonas sp. SCN 70-307]
MGHLLELRSRLLKGVVAVLLVFAALMPFANRIYAQLAAPLLSKLPAGGQLVAIEVASPFFTPVKLAFFCAVMLAMPVLIYQAWAFVAPGLYQQEKRMARPLLVAAVLLFYIGCAFAYFLVLPAVFGFLTAITPEGVAMMTDISRYLDFVLVIFLAFGLSFELPVAVVVLVLLGLVTPAQLREARGYVIVGVFILAAIITPPDVISQLMLAIPMCLLYELGIIAGALLKRPAPAAG